MTGLYLHIPYCESKCYYCDFNSYLKATLPPDERYVGALEREFEHRLGDDDAFSTVYVGGGTPTSLSPKSFSDLLFFLRERIHPEREWTVEVNPGTLTPEHLEALKEAGVNRVSVGIQSVYDEILLFLGRIHTAAEGRAAVEQLRSAGIENLSVDLIFGMPGLDEKRWGETLTKILDWDLPHISLYDLTIEEGTPFHEQGVKAAGDEFARRLYEQAMDRLTKAGYIHYEVSSFAKPGCESRHNLSVWNGGDYVGLGAGAHSRRKHRRSWNRSDVREYLAAVESNGAAEEGAETLNADQRAGEAMMLTLRLVQGRSLADVERAWGVELRNRFASQLSALVRRGFLEHTNNCIRPTREGLLHLDTILLEFFS